jgi:hypothetical protein
MHFCSFLIFSRFVCQCRQVGYIKRRNRKTKREVTTQLERISKVPVLVKSELDGIRSIITETAAMEVLLWDPFPPTVDVEGIKHSIVVKVMNKQKIKGNPADNVAYIMEQKAVSSGVFFFYDCRFLSFLSFPAPTLPLQMKDMLSAPKSSLLFQCIPLFNSIFNCIDVGGVKKPDASEKNRKKLREYLSYKNRFIFKSAEDDMKAVIADPSLINETDKAFKVRTLQLLFFCVFFCFLLYLESLG